VHKLNSRYQLFNSVAILLGFGMLSEPIAFAYAGWIGGMALLIAYGYVQAFLA
jgi:vesicular inhibitory amino acid transporter